MVYFVQGKIREGGSGSQDLLYAEVPVLSEAACRSRYRRNQITDSMLCAGLARGGKDSCQGRIINPQLHFHVS